MDFNNINNSDLVKLYGNLVSELKERKIIRSKNVVGDLGEYIAIDYYTTTPGLPKLQPAPPSTKNIDAISVNGDRYSIKSTTTGTTGVFYGLNEPNSGIQDTQKFEFVIIVMFDENYNLERINELTWTEFIHFKRWHSRMRAWNLTVTRDLLENTRTIFKKEL